ncbi:helix-turn-helix domain-containing protein [Streptomyces sp. NPDC046985]|uniref:helix-turn-helix domain-containing protein n=1 Tax=Streptomyces sp. NPDC046985 TaxID=3155377 RepID=UPI0033D4AB66
MPRVSRAVAEQRRQQVIESVSRLIREKGAEQVSVPEAMAAAGLTHGGFYRHFSSKDDLVAQALAAAFDERGRSIPPATGAEAPAGAGEPADAGKPADAGEPAHAGEAAHAGEPGVARPADRSARAAFLAAYLSERHRDNPARGCAAAALAADVARTEPGTALRAAFTTGLHDMVDSLRRLDGAPDGADSDSALVELSTLVGALLLARASDDDALSRDILRAAHQHLTAQSDASRA